VTAAEIVYTEDERSDTTPAEQQLMRDAERWRCICFGELEDGQWVHSLACIVRRSDGIKPSRKTPLPLLRESPGVPDEKMEGQLTPPPEDRAGKIAWAKQARAAGMTYKAIGAAVGIQQPQAWQWVNNPHFR
jgi:hypothetical protein